MTLAIITTAIFGTLATLALLYAMHLRGENDALRVERDDAVDRADEAEQRADRLSKSIGRHLREGIVYQHEVNHLERRNAYLEQHHRVVMARWWKRRHYRTLSAWKVTGGVL